jgi:hypothetical protein
MRKTNKRSIKLAYQVLGILFLCVSLIYFTYRVTSAWFEDTSTTSNGVPSVEVIGTIDVDVRVGNNNAFEFTYMSLSPDTLYYNPTPTEGTIDYATYIKAGQSNNIGNIYVRVQFACNRDELSLYFHNSLTTTGEAGKWIYSYEDTDNDDVADTEYYYYLGSVGSDSEIIFNNGYKVNNSLHNGIANAPVEMNIRVEALQRPYGAYLAEWGNAPKAFHDFAAGDFIPES